MREQLRELRTRWRRWRLLRAYSRVFSVRTGKSVGFTTDDDGYLVPELEEFLRVQAAVERVLEGETKYRVEKDTGVSRRTLTRILDDPDRLRLYIDVETDDDQLADALAGADVEAADLPDGFEERIREVVREELQEANDE